MREIAQDIALSIGIIIMVMIGILTVIHIIYESNNKNQYK